MDSIALKPCPFCGACGTMRAWKHRGVQWNSVRCDNAGCLLRPRTVGYRKPEDAAADWNHRPGENGT